MSQKESNSLNFTLVFLVIFFSCSKTIKNDDYVFNNFSKYKIEFNLIRDSVNFYANNLLKEFTSEYMYKWQIDSLICINSDKSKLVATINSSTGTGVNSKMDDITILLGKKINGKWLFFKGGGTLYIPRDTYGKNEMHPLNFHELSQIARKEMFGEYALIKKNGEYIPNDVWIDQYFYNNGFHTFGKHKIPGMVTEGEQFQMPRDKAKFDSVHWSLILDKWIHKFDTNEYKKQSSNFP